LKREKERERKEEREEEPCSRDIVITHEKGTKRNVQKEQA